MVLSLVHCKEEEVDPLLAKVEILEHKEIIDPYGRGETYMRDINVTVKNNHSKKLSHISLLAKWYYPNGEVEESTGTAFYSTLSPENSRRPYQKLDLYLRRSLNTPLKSITYPYQTIKKKE